MTANVHPRPLKLHFKGFKSIFDQAISLQPLTTLLGASGAGTFNRIQFISLLSHMRSGGSWR